MRKKMTELRRHISVFWSLLFANLVPALCSVLLLALVLVPLMNGAAKENDAAHEDNILYTVSTFFEGLNADAEDVVNRMEQNPWLHEIYIDHILNGKLLSYDTKDTVTTDLGILAAQQNILLNISFQYYGEADTVYTSSGVFSNIAYFREIAPEKVQYFFFPLEDAEPGFSSVTHNGQSYLIYRDRFQDIAGGSDKGEANLVFQSGRIGRRLLALTEGEAAAFRIVSPEGAVLWEYQTADAPAQTATISGISRSTQYRYEVDVPLSVHARTVNRVRPWIAAAILLDLLICIGFSVFLSRINYQPVESIVRKFAGDVPKNDNELVSLDHVLDRILLEKSETENSLDRLRPLARQKLLGGLLDGAAFLEEVSVDQLHYCALEFAYPCFNVIAVQVPFSRLTGETRREQRAELTMEALTERCESCAAAKAYLYYEDSNRYRILLNYEKINTLQAFVSLLSEESRQYFLRTDNAEPPVFGVGRAVRKSGEIYRAAEQAVTALNFAVLNHTGCVSYYGEVAAQICSDYFYPFSEEMLLARAVSEGNVERAKAILRGVIETNQNQPHQNPQTAQFLYADLCSTILRSAQGLGITCRASAGERTRRRLCSLEQVQASVEILIDEVFQQIDSRRCEPVTTAEQKILAYIDENLFNPNLSLGSIAETFGRSTGYISTLFKNQKGMNYSDYVNQVRIRRAVELLTGEHMDTESVYHAVGYVSLSTFRRNFIKYTGRSPGDFSAQESVDGKDD